MKVDVIIRGTPSLLFSKKIGRVKLNTSIVVVEGKENVLVCHIVRGRKARTSKGLGLLTISFNPEPSQ